MVTRLCLFTNLESAYCAVGRNTGASIEIRKSIGIDSSIVIERARVPLSLDCFDPHRHFMSSSPPVDWNNARQCNKALLPRFFSAIVYSGSRFKLRVAIAVLTGSATESGMWHGDESCFVHKLLTEVRPNALVDTAVADLPVWS